MADVVQLFPSPAPPDGVEDLAAPMKPHQWVVYQLEDAAEFLDEPGANGHGAVLCLLTRVLVDHYGVQPTLDLLETAQFLAVSLGGRTPPGNAA